MRIPPPPFTHLHRLTDETGLMEHALGIVARQEHGYCTDDVARGLIVVSREPEPAADVVELGRGYLHFVLRAQAPDGRCHNRLGIDGHWQDHPETKDWWGRAIWGLGSAVCGHLPEDQAALALRGFESSARQRSPWPRAMAYAALGAAEVLVAYPGHAAALSLLRDAIPVIGRPRADPQWPWPEPRLTYGNAVVPDALLAAGFALGDDHLVRDALALLEWLLRIETRDGHFSVTPVGGWGPGDPRPGFDQQPIEVAALADACARAWSMTGDARWANGIDRAVAWFLGDNDSNTPLYDPASGGGCDGLEATGCNTNQGAESTLALVSTLQHGRRLALAVL